MPLVPLSAVRYLAPWLRPLRALAARRWLREAEIDGLLALLNPTWRLNRVFARVQGRRWVADDMLALTLQPNGNWRGARPGQHVRLYLEVAGVRLSRSYSLTALHADGSLEIAIKRQPGGRLSNRLLDWVAVGQVLEIGQPFGELCWVEQAPGVLLLAAGSGLTPLLGLLRGALAQGFGAPVTLLHYVRRHGQRAFVHELQALQAQHANLRVRWALSGDPAQAGELSGRFAAEHLHELGDVERRSVFACGPAGFVEQVQGWWHGAPRDGQLQVETFSPPAFNQAEPVRPVRLRFARAQREVQGDSRRSLLEQAEAEGLRPAHGCRQGICASCTCLLLSGAVRDLRSGALFSEPNQPIRLCVSAPQGDVAVDV
ncbi:flavin reductase family protein [Pseudomonas sp. 2FG]|uniref:flavin reductase family protein n=1 Tax=Pseudomonas sp. 2FG TaxID=2502191 RepID=UPI0010F7A8B7|nr:iron-sulfur cluster-binding domain-containing protein [Pseudomonas sp. 2FG]